MTGNKGRGESDGGKAFRGAGTRQTELQKQRKNGWQQLHPLCSQVPQPTCFWKWVSKAVRSRNPTTRRVSCSTKGALNRGGRGRVGDNTLRTPHAHCTTAIPSFNVGGGIGSLAHTTHSNVLSGLKILLCRWRCSEEDIPSKYQTLNYEFF